MDVMIDLETWGTEAGCALRSIGAVSFDRRGILRETFSANISLAEQLARGLTTNEATVAWWAKQGSVALAAPEENQRSLEEVAPEFHEWFRRVGGETVWSHGSIFDVVLWTAAVRAFGYSPPWNFHNVRDTRTAFDLLSYDYNTERAHIAVEDAKAQAAAICTAIRRRFYS